MAYSNDLCKLVINNMDIIEEAPSVVGEVEELLFEAINKRIREKIEPMEGWEGIYDLCTEKNEDEEMTIFRAPRWPIDDEGEYLAWYELGIIDGDEIEDANWLTYAVGVKESRLVIGFDSDKKYHGNTPGQLKKFFRNYFEHNPQLAQAGVIFEDGYLGIPFHLDPEKMSEEYPNFNECLKPVDDALDALLKAHPYFDTLVDELKK
ncbi:MAG: hypothetical protein WCR47_03960 [Desulfoplanes sp.]